jgi:hypothetical protein
MSPCSSVRVSNFVQTPFFHERILWARVTIQRGPRCVGEVSCTMRDATA